jgi:histone acetyltransferase 1
MDSFNSKKRAAQEDFLDSAPNKKKNRTQGSPINESQEENEEENEDKDVVFANDVIFLRFISNPVDMLDSNPLSFKPEFTNQIFGEEEEIHGYEDLKITINFLQSQFYANIDVSYSKKNDDADNLHELFGKVFKGGYYKEKQEFEKLFSKEKEFKPFGKNIKNFQIEDIHYEVQEKYS